jgi:hypothetical protein
MGGVPVERNWHESGLRSTAVSGQDPNAAPPALVVVENWTEELKARAGTK